MYLVAQRPQTYLAVQPQQMYLAAQRPQTYLAAQPQLMYLVAQRPQTYLAAQPQLMSAVKLPPRQQAVLVAAKPQLPQQALVQLLQLVQPHWKWK